jgi:Mg-chelatase subunit ChlD
MWIELVQPLALWGLAVLPLFLLLHLFTRSHLPLDRRVLALVFRLLAVTLLVFSMANPRVIRSAESQAVAFLLDYSDSVAPDVREQEVAWVRQAMSAMSDRDQSMVIVFGEHAAIDHPLSNARELAPVSTVVGGGETNISEALRLAMASLPTTAARSIVLLSDGNETVGKALDQARVTSAARVPISTVSMSTRSGPEVLVRQVETPSQVREGESFSAIVTIESNTETAGRLHLLSDNRVLATREVDLSPGTNTIVMPQEPLSPGFHLFKAQLEATDDTFPQNNEGGSYTVVSGRPTVLIVEGDPGEARFLSEALNAAGLQTDVKGPTEAPSELGGFRPYESVVLVNVRADKLTTTQMKSIQGYVQSLGGGLVVIGGDHSYGVGRYARTPLEDALPVKMDLRGKTLTASVALVLVIDASGSMAGGPGASKMDLAKEAAVRATELLGEQDQIGVISFDDTPRWVIEMQNMTDPSAVQSGIGGISPGGGTAIFPALETAYDALVQREAKVKHIILLTDGLSTGGDYDALTNQMRADNISLSTIAVGSDADFNLLRKLADIGQGRYYEGNDPFDLPQLVVKETQEVARAAIVEEPFRPLVSSSSPIMDGFDANSLPPLYGYVSTTPKPSSQTILLSRSADPLLSEWQYGLGRVVSWTSDAENRWAQDWVSWSEFGRFWAQAVKRTIPSPLDRNNQVTVRNEAGGVKITVDSVADDRSYVNFVPTTGTLVTPDGSQVPLTLPQVGPGRYQTQVTTSQEGPYFLNISQQGSDGQMQVSRPAGFVVPYSAEYRALKSNTDLLSQIARATGGTALADPAQAFSQAATADGTPREIWPALLLAASLLLLVDIAVRRLRLGINDARAWLERLAMRLGATARLASAPAHAGLSAARQRLLHEHQGTQADVQLRGAASRVRGADGEEVTERPATAASLSARLLDAKKRAAQQKD